MNVLLARVRLPAQYLGILCCLAGGVVGVAGRVAGLSVGVVVGALAGVGVALIVLAAVTTFAAPPGRGEPLAVGSPVRGRWQAVNSPTDRVPSHGSHAYGQTYAVDLVYVPRDQVRPEFGRADGAFLPPDRFPAFGQPVIAPADGVVVRAVDTIRDHRSRSTWAALLWFYLEALPRELLGVRGVIGNHIVIRLEDGTHFVLAHLRRASLRVRVGDRVTAGQHVAECGNTGNSTEPHLHCQRQDVAATFVALGLPWTIEQTGIPRNGEHLGE